MPTQQELDTLNQELGLLNQDAAKLTLTSQADAITEVQTEVAAVANAADSLTPYVPPPPRPLDPMLIYDKATNAGSSGIIGSLCSLAFYNPIFPWNNPGGDWYGVDGPQGSIPYASSANLPISTTGYVQIDITGMLPFLMQGAQLCLRGKQTSGSAAAFTIQSRDSATPPSITWDNGSAKCLADVQCPSATMTHNELGSNPTWNIGGTDKAYLRFPPVPSDAKGRIYLNLYILKAYASGIIEVYDGTWRSSVLPPSPFTLKGDSRVFLETQDFSNIPDYLKHSIFGDPAHGILLDTYGQRNIIRDETGNTVLQITFDPRVNAALTASVLFPGYREASEAAIEYDMRLMPDLAGGLVQGIKCFAGFSSSTKSDDAYYASINGTPPGRTGTLLAGNGGAKTHGNDGWSMRFDMWKPVTDPDHPLFGHMMPTQYAYWPGQSDYYGDPWSWSGCGFSPKLGEWHTYASRFKVNSLAPGGGPNMDSELDGWIDQYPALVKRGFYVRTTDTPLIAQPPYNVDSQLRIGRIWLNTYHGGVQMPASRCSIQIRNFRAAQFA